MWVEIAIGVISGWMGVGAAFAPLFVTRGVQRVDPLARGATIGFRLAIVPGVLLFWPLLATRWLRGWREPPVEHTAHRRQAARLMAAARERVVR